MEMTVYDMESRLLYTFRTIATLGSFSKAAEVLDYAQSTVSEQMKTLEQDLNVKLFDREGRHTTLTPAGVLLLEYAQKMLDLEEEIRSELKRSDEVYGSLSVRIPETISTYFLPDIVKEFHGRFPRVSLYFNACTYHGLTEELRSGITNLAFLITDDFVKSGMDSCRLREIPLVMVTYPGNPVALNRNVHLSDITEGPLYMTISDCSYFRIIESYFMEERIDLPNIHRINSIAAIKRNIIAGTGIALLPRITVEDEISSGRLAVISLQRGPLSAHVFMIWLKNKWHPPILKEFMRITKKVLSPGPLTSD
ncbi:MAG: LysR family transcriptional regulator [Spirochaetes bacterium]|nr:LysR family transcriptional regulator [Spirochaetota bacterium]